MIWFLLTSSDVGFEVIIAVVMKSYIPEHRTLLLDLRFWIKCIQACRFLLRYYFVHRLVVHERKIQFDEVPLLNISGAVSETACQYFYWWEAPVNSKPRDAARASPRLALAVPAMSQQSQVRTRNNVSSIFNICFDRLSELTTCSCVYFSSLAQCPVL